MSSKEMLLAICDPEAEYLQLFHEYLKKSCHLTWKVHAFTDLLQLQKAGAEKYCVLVIAESAYVPELLETDRQRVIVLNESGLKKWEGVTYVDKYQKAELVKNQILQYYAEFSDRILPRLQKKYNTRLIGFFSPLRRSLQTSFSLTVGQLLAAQHEVLYLNFEPFSGRNALFADSNSYDLSDLLYFLGSDKDKFPLRMEVALRRLGELSYVPPMRFGQNLLGVSSGEWINLLSTIEEMGEYEYILLDLSECVQGIFEILGMCERIFTMTGRDETACSKILQYEQILQQNDLGEVLQKTEKLCLPVFHTLPDDYEQLTKSELAKVAENMLKGIGEQ